MADLVERLRSWKQVLTTPYPIGYYLDTGLAAADEIDRLQSLLETANAYGASENKARIEEREQLAQMMIRQSLSTGHGDTVGDLVRELEPQIKRLRAEVERMHDVARDAAESATRHQVDVLSLRAALQKIAAIENQMFGPDWEEIDQAREIAKAALGGRIEND